jgi:WD40 repeat protein
MVVTGTGYRNHILQLWETSSGKALTTLQGSNGMYYAMFSPDGQRLLTRSENIVRLLETNSGKALATLQGHTSSVNSVEFSPDGSMVLTGSRDGTARLWKVTSDKALATLQRHTEDVRSMVFSSDGQMVLTIANNFTARLWETSNGKARYILEGHSRTHVVSAAFSPDGRILLTGSSDGTVLLREVSSGKILATLQRHKEGVRSVVFSPDGQMLLTIGNDNTARLSEASSGRTLTTLQSRKDMLGLVYEEGVWSAAFSPDSSLLLTVESMGTPARLREASSGKVLATLQGHTDFKSNVGFSPDGRIAVTTNADGWILFWEVPGVQRERPLGLYIVNSNMVAVYWQDATHLVLADTFGMREYPSIHRLSLEGPGWKSVEPAE